MARTRKELQEENDALKALVALVGIGQTLLAHDRVVRFLKNQATQSDLSDAIAKSVMPDFYKTKAK